MLHRRRQPQFLDAALALLERKGSLRWGVASTSDEALRRVEDVKPAVVLIDVDLGNESCFNLARRFQSETSLDRSRVILISTCAEEDLRDLITAAPVAAFLSKSRIGARYYQILSDTGGPNPLPGV